MTNTTNRAPTVHRISGLMVFLLLAMLAIFSLVSVMLGVQIYNNVVATAETNSSVRTSLSYVVSKVRANDAAGMVELRNIDGIDVIVLGSFYGEERYNTYIYYYNGALMEYDGADDREFDPAYGANSIIAKVPYFGVTFDGELFTFTITDNEGVDYVMHLYLNASQSVQEEGVA